MTDEYAALHKLIFIYSAARSERIALALRVSTPQYGVLLRSR